MKKSLILGFCTAAALSGCGGGDYRPPPTPAVTSEVPASASLTVDGFIGYMKALVASAADTLQPVDVSTVTPPTDDTIQPSVVD